MTQIHELRFLLNEISNSKPNAALSARVVANAIGLSISDGMLWIGEFGDPLNTLPATKAFVEQLGFDWHEALSAAATALEGQGQWLLPDLAPHAIAWVLFGLIEDASEVDPRRARSQ